MPLTRRELRARDAHNAMHASEPLPVLAEAHPATVTAPAEPAAPTPAEPAPQRRARRRGQGPTPVVPAPQKPVQHIVLDASPAPAAEAPVIDEPAAAVNADAKRTEANTSAAKAPEAERPSTPDVEATGTDDAPQESASQESAPRDTAPQDPTEEPVDLFIEAARALNFTGETPLVSETTRPVQASPRRAGAHHGARRGRPSAARRVATVTASISAFGVVGLLAVGMTTPFTAIAGTESTVPVSTSIAAGGPADETDDDEIQAFVAPAEVKNAQIERSTGYEATTFAEIAAVSGINTANAVYVNDPTADIQWPIVLGTSMSSPFGQRWGRLHEGIDFTPGEGAPVQAIADGTVRIATEAGGAYGVNVYIDHVIDGEMITSHYAHMQYGSLRVVAGQKVKVGDVIGLVGNTGRSYGAHLHFEIRLPSGQAIDPMPWLKEHAGTHYRRGEKAADPVEETVGEVAGQ